MPYIPPQLQIDTERENQRLGFLQGAVNSFGDVMNARQKALDKESAMKRQDSQDSQAKMLFDAKIKESKYAEDQRALPYDQQDEYLKASALKKLQMSAEMDAFKQQENIRHNNNKSLLTTKAQAESATKGPSLSEAEKAVDKKYAEKYVNQSGSGFVNSEHTIKKLEALAKEMEADQGIGEAGGTRLPIPDMLRSRDAIRRRDETRNAANSTLKELFGGQLSDGERAAASKEYYNDELDNASNAKILRSKIDQLKAQRSAELERAKYFEENRTLKGFKTNPNRISEGNKFKPEHVEAVKGMSDAELLQIINGQ